MMPKKCLILVCLVFFSYVIHALDMNKFVPNFVYSKPKVLDNNLSEPKINFASSELDSSKQNSPMVKGVNSQIMQFETSIISPRQGNVIDFDSARLNQFGDGSGKSALVNYYNSQKSVIDSQNGTQNPVLNNIGIPLQANEKTRIQINPQKIEFNIRY